MNKLYKFMVSAFTSVKQTVVAIDDFLFPYFSKYLYVPVLRTVIVFLDAIIATNNWFKKRLERAPAPIRWLYNNGVLLFIEKTYLSLVFGTKRKIIKAIVKWLKLTFGLTSRFAYTLVVIVLLMLPVVIWLAYDSMFKLNKEIAPDNFVAGE